jgi:hypothetical protein
MPDPAGNPIGYQQLTVTTSPQSLTVPAGAVRAIITAEGDTVRYRDDGGAPTSTLGLPLTALASIELISGGSIANFQVIKDASATSTPLLNISYYKRS